MTNMQLGIVGLSTMGGNLARNAARNGARTVVFNRTTEKMEQFVAEHGAEGEFVPAKTLKEFVAALTPPRPVLLMVKAGQPVDDVMEELLPLLSPGDILIDAGNSHYHDTERRTKRAEEARVHFVGMGVSGGEEGALKGPSMMPGGDKEAIDVLMPLFAKMAAHDGSTEPALSGAEGLTTGGDAGSCIAYMGPGGAGHFVKMVHNGIEYGIMQLIAEAYHLLKVEGGLSNPQLAEVFGQWNSKGFLQSFLIEITERVFRMKDAETSGDLIDVILDSAGQKGTGKWTTEAAFHYGVAVPTITAAVDARIMSSGKAFRTQEAARWQLAKRDVPLPTDFAEQVRTALELSVIELLERPVVACAHRGLTQPVQKAVFVPPDRVRQRLRLAHPSGRSLELRMPQPLERRVVRSAGQPDVGPTFRGS